MPFAWLVECKTCLQRFAIRKREVLPGKSTDSLQLGVAGGEFECPHCHERHHYMTDDYIPAEGRIHSN